VRHLDCPRCGAEIPLPFPLVTVDCIVTDETGRVLLVRRRYPPPGWALPGGFVEMGETLETAVARELREETGLVLGAARQFHAYSDPARDARHPIVTVVFHGRAAGTPRAGDDAADARFFPLDALPEEMAFDHRAILREFSLRGDSGGPARP
jgi:8-oxo-dGTP diphosphatase